MGCCTVTQVDYLGASSTIELASMMMRQKEGITNDIENMKYCDEDTISFMINVCKDTDHFARVIRDCDFKDNFSELKHIVFVLYLAVKLIDISQYNHEKKNMEILINHYNVLEL